MKSWLNQDLISALDLDADNIMHLTNLALVFKRFENDTAVRGSLKDKLMGSLFYQPSTRTRLGTEQAIRWLGGHVQGFSGIEGTSVEKGECICDTLHMVGNFNCDVIAIRHPLMGSAQLAADYLKIPVVNCGDGSHEHPTQALLDFLTIWEKKVLEQGKNLDGLNVVFAGDLKYGRTVHSNIITLSKFPNINIGLVAADQVALPRQYLRLLKQRGVNVTDFGTDLRAAIKKADVLYDTRVQKEWFDDTKLYEKVARALKITPELVGIGKDSLIIMHPLPRNKKVREIDYSVDDLPQAAYMDQANNGLYMRMAILYSILNPLSARITDEQQTKPQPQSVLVKKPIRGGRRKKRRDERLPDIISGTVLDHIPAGKASEIVYLIKDSTDAKVEYAEGLKGKNGTKDVVKVRGQIDDEKLLTKIALLSGRITYNVIEDGRVVYKANLRPPKMITDVVQCPNPRCVTAPEHDEKILGRKVYNLGKLLQCHYCGHEASRSEFSFI